MSPFWPLPGCRGRPRARAVQPTGRALRRAPPAAPTAPSARQGRLPWGALLLLCPIACACLGPGAALAAAQDAPALGLVVDDVPEARLAALGVEHGVSVRAVMRWSPAGRVGIVPGDIVTALDGTPVYTAAGLEWLESKRRRGESVTLTVWRPPGSAAVRDGELAPGMNQVEVVLTPVSAAPEGAYRQVQAQAPRGEGFGAQDPGEELRGRGEGWDRGVWAEPREARTDPWAWLGVRVRPLTNPQRERLGIPENLGVLVADVLAGSPAADVGLRSGDVLVSIDRRIVRSPVDLYRALGFFDPGELVVLRTLREGGTRTVVATLGRTDALDDLEPEYPYRLPPYGPSGPPAEREGQGAGGFVDLYDALPGGGSPAGGAGAAAGPPATGAPESDAPPRPLPSEEVLGPRGGAASGPGAAPGNPSQAPPGDANPPRAAPADPGSPGSPGAP